MLAEPAASTIKTFRAVGNADGWIPPFQMRANERGAPRMECKLEQFLRIKIHMRRIPL